MSNLRKVSGKELEDIAAIGDVIFSELRTMSGNKANAVLSYVVAQVFLNTQWAKGSIDEAITEWSEGIRKTVARWGEGR